ncbi:MAG TPA: response regulator, partial [Gemmatimonadales bacterium]|nr:response regulator [Gemmatimonadales bacterium]
MSHTLSIEDDGAVAEPHRILLVEDVESDAELIARELHRAGLHCVIRRVQTEPALRSALAEFVPELVFTDHALPGYSARDALRLVRSLRPGTPVIIVTGSLDEETAAEYALAGAVDYVIKSRLFRLGPSVRRALALRRAEADATRAAAALRDLEEQHRQVQKMEAIGRLASGVAHDFNNMLTVITTCCAFALEALPDDSKVRADLLEIRDTAARAATLTKQLLSFSRQQPVAPQRVDLRALVENLSGMLRRLLGGGVTVTFTAPPELGAVWADPGQIEQ